MLLGPGLYSTPHPSHPSHQGQGHDTQYVCYPCSGYTSPPAALATTGACGHGQGIRGRGMTNRMLPMLRLNPTPHPSHVAPTPATTGARDHGQGCEGQGAQEEALTAVGPPCFDRSGHGQCQGAGEGRVEQMQDMGGGECSGTLSQKSGIHAPIDPGMDSVKGQARKRGRQSRYLVGR